jgi:hypothetical protein
VLKFRNYYFNTKSQKRKNNVKALNFSSHLKKYKLLCAFVLKKVTLIKTKHADKY